MHLVPKECSAYRTMEENNAYTVYKGDNKEIINDDKFNP
jgi:hypothetical protein